MVRQVGAYQIGDDGLMRSGVILRHLVLPGQMENTKRVIDYVSTHFPPKTVLFFAHEPVYAAARFDRCARAALK